jgi:predicted outer membrane lipoprotein
MLVRAFFLWLLMSVLAVANGVIRTLWITPHLGEATAHILGTLSALILLFGAIVLILPWVGPRNKNPEQESGLDNRRVLAGPDLGL